MFQEKNPEVSVCDASLIRNVWEIRAKTYNQKLKKEQERVHKSALEQINLQWQSRMTSKKRGPPRLERRARPSESAELQKYLNKSSLSDVTRNTSFQNSRFKREGGRVSKRGKMIINIFERQPSLLQWGKSWKFSKPKPYLEEDSEVVENGLVSDWGKSWKFLTHQPNLEGKAWSELNLPNDDLDFLEHNGLPFPIKEAKLNSFFYSQDLEQNMCLSEWGQSWKVTKQCKSSEDKESLSEEGQANRPFAPHKDLMYLSNGGMLNSELHGGKMSEWTESWKVSKPPARDFHSEIVKTMEVVDHEENQETTPASTWFDSWMILYNQLPKKQSQPSQSSEWGGSWRYLQFPPTQEKESIPVQEISKESPDIQTFERIYQPKEGRLKQLFSFQLHSEDWFSEWCRSWKITKPHAQAQSDEQEVPENEPITGKSEGIVDVKPHQEVYVSIKSKSRQLLSPEYFSNEPSVSQWAESWKSLKHKLNLSNLQISQESQCQDSLKIQPYNDMMFYLKSKKSQILFETNLHEEQPSMANWDQSWKFLNLPLQQKKESWDRTWTKYLLHDYHCNTGIHGFPQEANANLNAKWRKSWKMSSPPPHFKTGSWLEAQGCRHQNASVLQPKVRDNQFINFQQDKDKANLRLWVHSWKILKSQAEQKTKSKSGKNSSKDSTDLQTYIKSRRSKAKKILLAQLEKEKVSPTKWVDAWRLAKSQPRQKRGSWLKLGKESVNEEKADHPDWSQSWKFQYSQQSEEKSFMSEWEESWKYLLTHQQEEGERSK